MVSYMEMIGTTFYVFVDNIHLCFGSLCKEKMRSLVGKCKDSIVSQGNGKRKLLVDVSSWNCFPISTFPFSQKSYYLWEMFARNAATAAKNLTRAFTNVTYFYNV